jgi:aldehyde:ferredoxin oxidoreductase
MQSQYEFSERKIPQQRRTKETKTGSENMKRLLRIDMSTLRARTEEVPKELRQLGGRGLSSSLVSREVPPMCDPLGPENKIVFAPGILAGTVAPNTGRLSVGAKSPLTKGIKESNVGGTAAQRIARLGYQAVVVEGIAKEPTLVKISKEGVTFSSAADLAGLGNYAVFDRIKDQFGGKVSAIAIGPAGEKKLTAAAIAVSAPDFSIRVAGRGGLGAVLGSKNVKAIVLDDKGCGPVKVENPRKMKEGAAALAKGFAVDGFCGALKQFGTPIIVMITNSANALPTKNFSAGQFDGAGTVCGEHMLDVMKERPNSVITHRCMDGCVVGCSNVYTDEKGEFVVAGLEYETIALAGSNCMIGDLDIIARINRLCNDIGLDTMDVGGALAVAMEAGLLPWGDGEGALKLIEEARKGTERGVMIGNGCRFTGDALKIRRTPTVKGQCLSGYDPRILKGTGVTFATSPMGADHTAGIVLPGAADPTYIPVVPTGQGPKSQFMQTHMATVDSLGLCMMPGIAAIETAALHQPLVDCVAALTGVELGEEYLESLGREVLRVERSFNDAAGFTAEDDRLPAFFSEEGMTPAGFVFDVPTEEIDSVNRFA